MKRLLVILILVAPALNLIAQTVGFEISELKSGVVLDASYIGDVVNTSTIDYVDTEIVNRSSADLSVYDSKRSVNALAGVLSGSQHANFSLGEEAFAPWGGLLIHPLQENAHVQIDFANIFDFPESIKIWNSANEKIDFELQMLEGGAMLHLPTTVAGTFQVEMEKGGVSKFFQLVKK